MLHQMQRMGKEPILCVCRKLCKKTHSVNEPLDLVLLMRSTNSNNFGGNRPWYLKIDHLSQNVIFVNRFGAVL